MGAGVGVEADSVDTSYPETLEVLEERIFCNQGHEMVLRHSGIVTLEVPPSMVRQALTLNQKSLHCFQPSF